MHEGSYENRVIAFIDILGWGKAVDDSATSPDLRRRLLNVVRFLGAQSKKDVEDDTPDWPSFDRATQFSDSVVVSCPYSGFRDLLRLTRQITSYQHAMLLSGFPLRGGIAVGSLYHQGSLVFGPGLNEAYRLESKHAIYPRVIIANSLKRQVEEAASSLPQHWPFVLLNEDGFYSTDYLTVFATSEAAKNQIDRMIENWLHLYKRDPNIYAKYEWLRTKWEAAKLDSGWRAEVSQHFRKLSNDGQSS